MNLLKAASTISLLTLSSRITGLLREIMVASYFGASAWTDAFNVAFRLPNLLRRMFAEGAFSQAFVPLLSQTRQTKTPEQTQELIDQVSTALFWILAGISALGVLLAPVLVWLTASGLHPAAFDAAVWMTRLMFPYAGLISLVALSAGILNTWKHFAIPAVTPALLNLAVIGAAIALHRLVHPPIYALAIGVMIGGVLQLAVQWPALRKYAVIPRFRLSFLKAWRSEGVHRVVKQMLPASLSVSVAQVSIVINTQIASHLHPGSVSWLAYADRLMEFPTALLGVALGSVLLPSLSRACATDDTAKYSTLLDWGLRLTLLLALPSAVALLLFAQPLVSMLFNYGRFDHADVLATTSALRAYGIGLIGLIGVKILAPGFYARQDLRTPVKMALIVLVATQLMNLLFVPWLGHAGLALAISLGALLNASLLFWGLRRRDMFQPQPGWARYAGKVLLAQLPLAALLAWGAMTLPWSRVHGDLARLGMGLGLLGSGAILYFVSLRLLGFRLRQFMHSE
ncbi:putative peptidoglycan biosynthesis protein MurJ [mine drainage metagenome]|uniref:Putative peptidoglycan biosynthesis protein MurJ n=1 Tax=mine drainage metagenome TaxID=410659 RepID=A0A1J5PT95_9ZZZZ